MKRSYYGWTVLAPMLILMLSGCGLIPDIEVSNPLQFDGASIPVQFGAAPTLRLQAVSGTGGLADPIPFSDEDINSAPTGPAALTIDGGFVTEVVLVADVYPDEIVLNDISLEVRLWQGAETFADASADNKVEPDPFTAGIPLTLNKVDAGCAASCTYAFAFPDVAGSSLQIEIRGSDLGKTLEIIGDSPNANFVDVTLSVTASSTPDIGPGSSLTLTLDAGDGVLTF